MQHGHVLAHSIGGGPSTLEHKQMASVSAQLHPPELPAADPPLPALPLAPPDCPPALTPPLPEALDPALAANPALAPAPPLKDPAAPPLGDNPEPAAPPLGDVPRSRLRRPHHPRSRAYLIRKRAQ